MLNFLKKIFQTEGHENKEVIAIKIQILEEWLNEKSKPLMDTVKLQTEEVLMKVNEEIERARFNIETLQNAKLQNPNIPFKAKQYMEGNRKAYMRAVNSFLGNLEINNKDYFYLLDFCKNFAELIDDINKGTIRSYTILQEFFANETNNIAENLKNFDTLFAQLNSVLNSEKMKAINKTRGKIQDLKAKAKQKINLNIDFKNSEADLKLANSEKETILSNIENFNKSDDHNNFLGLNHQKKSKTTAFYADEKQILQSFSILDRALRKYSHTAFEHEEDVLNYLKDPLGTLANDKKLKILKILKNLKDMLEKNNLQIDEKKKEKSVEEINKLDNEFIEQFQNKYQTFKTELGELEDRIKRTGVTEKFREFNEQLESTNLKIEKMNYEYGQLENGMVKLKNSIENLKNDIESSVKEIFGEEIKVII